MSKRIQSKTTPEFDYQIDEIPQVKNNIKKILEKLNENKELLTQDNPVLNGIRLKDTEKQIKIMTQNIRELEKLEEHLG